MPSVVVLYSPAKICSRCSGALSLTARVWRTTEERGIGAGSWAGRQVGQWRCFDRAIKYERSGESMPLDRAQKSWRVKGEGVVCFLSGAIAIDFRSCMVVDLSRGFTGPERVGFVEWIEEAKNGRARSVRIIRRDSGVKPALSKAKT